MDSPTPPPEKLIARLAEIAKILHRVADMRTAQKRYFETRKKQDLQASKDIELLVDQDIRRLQRERFILEVPRITEVRTDQGRFF